MSFSYVAQNSPHGFYLVSASLNITVIKHIKKENWKIFYSTSKSKAVQINCVQCLPQNVFHMEMN